MNFIHIADLHVSKTRAEPCKRVLETVLAKIEETEDTPKLIISGDFFDASINAGPTYGMFMSLMKKILNVTDVYMVYGTAHHEPADSLKGFALLGAHVYSMNTFEDCGDFEVVALPEPRRVNYTNYVKEGDDINEVINKMNEEFINGLPSKTKPRIVIGHGEILGVLFDSSLPCDSPVAWKPSLLKKINADYYAFGHIHNKQEVFENCWYAGSAYQKTFGELHDPGYIFVTIE